MFSAEKAEEEEHKTRMRKQASTVPVENRVRIALDADSEQISLPEEKETQAGGHRSQPALGSILFGPIRVGPVGGRGGGGSL